MIKLLTTFVLSFLSILPGTEEKTTIYLIGDSTCADKRADAFPETGWGTPFKTFFDESVEVKNHARNGRSTKTFISEGRWKNIVRDLKKNDYVFIQFGHNDEVPSKKDRYTTPGEFKANLITFVEEARTAGAIPVLLTPITRRSYENGKLIDTHASYAQLVREVAQAHQVPLIDMTIRSMDLVNNMGEHNSQLLYLHLEPGEHPNYPDGKNDNTHFNELGARKMAQLVLIGILQLELDLRKRIRNSDEN